MFACKLRSTGQRTTVGVVSCARNPPFPVTFLSCLPLSKPNTKLAHTAAALTCGFRRLPSRRRGARNTRAAHTNQVNITVLVALLIAITFAFQLPEQAVVTGAYPSALDTCLHVAYQLTRYQVLYQRYLQGTSCWYRYIIPRYLVPSIPGTTYQAYYSVPGA